MAAPSLGTMIAIGLDVLRTTLSSKQRSLLAQLGDVLTQVVEADNVEFWQQVGLVSRPPKAAPGRAACQVVVIHRGDRDVSVASRDLRGQELTGSLSEGETCIYAAGSDGNGQSRVLLKANGSINLYTRKGNSPDGAGLVLMIDPGTDSITILNSKGFGILVNEDGVRITSKGAGITLTEGGDCSMIGKGSAQVDGQTIMLGAVAAPGTNNALTGPTGIAGKASLKTFIE